MMNKTHTSTINTWVLGMHGDFWKTTALLPSHLQEKKKDRALQFLLYIKCEETYLYYSK